MRKSMLAAVLLAVWAPHTAQAYDARTDTIYVSCATIITGSQLVKVAPVVKLTMPWLPEGSSESQAGSIVNSEYWQYVVERENGEVRDAACGWGPTAAEAGSKLKSWLNGYVGSDVRRSVATVDEFWPPFLDFMFKRGRAIANVTRAQYVAEPAS